jgi:UvrD-like helicase C-terminal domain
MREVCSLIWLALVGAFRSRASLEAENTILRHQLNVLRRKSPKRPTFGMLDRLIFAGLYRLAPKVLAVLAIVKPETVIKWHRAGFRSYWRWKSVNRRCRFLTANLSSCWMETGTYTGARIAFDTALAQDAIMETSQELGGIHVMTIHRAKGKQFDGVIIVRKGVPGPRWTSSFIWRDDAAPYHRSRKILRVAVTRARKHVLILDPAFPNCPLLNGHAL